jgi:thiaminase/transcriptional activator TenA
MTTRLSQRLLTQADPVLQRALAMPFIGRLMDGSLPLEVFDRYLWWEREFVEAAVRVLGAAILRAPSAAAVHGHARTLHTLVSDQFDYFANAPGLAPPGPRSAALAQPLISEVIADAGTDSYAELVAGMLPSEILYACWCRHAVGRPSRHPAIAAWVHLHTVPPFTDQVDFLVGEVDALPVAPADEPALVTLIERRLELEIDFHAAAFLTG